MSMQRADLRVRPADGRAFDSSLKLLPPARFDPLQPQNEDGLIEALGVAVYTTDAAGRITQYNEAAVELWGRRPQLGKDLWCGSLDLYYPDGTPMAHDECPMAITLKENRSVRGEEAIALRPDGTRVHFMPFPTPLRDASGNLIGAVNVLVDLTDREQAQEARREAEARYRNIFENAVFGLFRTDAEGHFSTANQAMAEIFGYVTVEELQGGIADIAQNLQVSSPDWADFLEAMKTTGEAHGFEVQLHRKDGSTMWVSLAARAATDESGKIIGYDGILEDVTARKQAELALRASEGRFSTAFHASPAAMCIVRGGDRRFIDVNEAFLKMLGYERQELIGRDATELDLWVDAKDRAKIGQVLLEKGAMRNELLCLFTRSREIRQVIGSAEVITLSDETCVIILLHDITERIEAETALRRLQTDLTRRLAEEQVVNQIAALLRTALDLQTVCEAALSAVLSHTGTEFGMLAAKRGDEAGLIASLGLPRRYLKPYRRMVATTPSLLAGALFNGRAAFSPKKALPALTARMFQANGTNRFAVVPLVAHGSVVGALQVSSQRSGSWSRDQRRFLVRIADQAAMAVASALQYEQLEQAFRSRDEGVRTIAHEIRTPLTAIKGFAQIATSQLERDDVNREQLKDSLEEINGAAERLAKFASHMMSASSIEDGLNRIQKEECQLGPFLRDAIREFTTQELTTKVLLRRVPRLKLQCDPQLMRQVLWNLLSNAVRHSPPGGEVVVSARQEEGHAKIYVSDSGPGVPPRERKRLFEKFHRGRNGDSNRDHEGLGLGLYLAQQVMEAHDGRIWYEPAEPQGATFCFSLPLDGRCKNGR
jgi:PAS domain S-box-containing protein